MPKIHKHLDLFVEGQDRGTKIDSYCCDGLREKNFWSNRWSYCPFCGEKVKVGKPEVSTHNVQDIINKFMSES